MILIQQEGHINNLLLYLSIALSNGQVEAVLNFTNVGMEHLFIKTRFAVNASFAPDVAKDLSFKIIGPHGPVEFSARVNPPPMDNNYVTELHSGASIKTTVSLTTYYQFTEKGEYAVQVFYENNSDFNNITLWKGSLVSNEVRFLNNSSR